MTIETEKDGIKMRSPASQMTGIPMAAAGAFARFACPSAVQAADRDVPRRGKAIGFDSTKGNCLACHWIEDGESPGDLGPPLVAIRARHPDKTQSHQPHAAVRPASDVDRCRARHVRRISLHPVTLTISITGDDK